MTAKRSEWLTQDVEALVRKRAKPWFDLGVPVVEHFESLPQANHRRMIQRKLDAAPGGAYVIGALPADSGIVNRFDGCWTVLHECVAENGPSVIVVRKGFPIRKTYKILVPGIWQVGDTYSMFNLFAELKRRLHDVEFHFEHDVTRIYFDARVTPEKEADTIPWDGVLNHSPFWGEIGSRTRWVSHFYEYPFEIAKRMGWLPRDARSPELPPPFPISEHDEEWAREHVPYAAGSYAAIVPQSSWWPRDWPAERSVRLAQWLDKHGVPTVFIGMKGKSAVVEGYEFKRHTGLLGLGNIGEVAAVMKHARLVVSPDTGLLHIACGLQVPTVATFGPSQYDHVTRPPVVPVHRTDGGCFECYRTTKYHTACNGSIECMQMISVDQVIQAVADQLKLFPSQEWKKPLVSLCMMVKNEMKMLPGAIESARPLVDEIIVVDTGSTDGTQQWLAAQPGVQLFNYDVGQEIQSFSDVRNFSLSKAHCKYVLWLDACERLVDAADLRKIVNQGRYDCYALPIIHGTIRYVREKIVLRELARFCDRIHEFIDIEGLWKGRVEPQLGVIRLLYEKQNRESSESRNIRLLKKQLEEAPDHPRRTRWLYHLGRDLADAKRFDEAVPYLQKRIGLEGFWEERLAAGVLLCRIYLYDKKDYKRATKTAESVRTFARHFREGLYLQAESLYWRGKLAEALPLYEQCVGMPKPKETTIWVWEEVYTWLPWDRISRCRERLGDMPGAVEAAKLELASASALERDWIVERIKALSGVPTLV